MSCPVYHTQVLWLCGPEGWIAVQIWVFPAAPTIPQPTGECRPPRDREQEGAALQSPKSMLFGRRHTSCLWELGELRACTLTKSEQN